MSDASDFYAAMRANPGDDALRLVFADWLDEHPSDWNTSCAEFIRLSCRGGKALPVAAGRWLARNDGSRGNWRRLCPAFVEWCSDSGAHPVGTSIKAYRKGRWIAITRYRSEWDRDRCDLEFSRGFVKRVVCRDWRFADIILPLLIVDQPLIEPEIKNLICDFHVGTLWRNEIGPAYDLIQEYEHGKTHDGRRSICEALCTRARMIIAGTAKAGFDSAVENQGVWD